MKFMKYVWYIPALYVAYFFGGKLFEGLAHSQEFIGIISLVPFLKNFAYSLTPLMGIFDFCVGLILLLNPFITKSLKIHRIIFVWVILWPFVPASFRYFGGVGDFEIVEVLSVSIAALVAYLLWEKYSQGEQSSGTISMR